MQLIKPRGPGKRGMASGITALLLLAVWLGSSPLIPELARAQERRAEKDTEAGPAPGRSASAPESDQSASSPGTAPAGATAAGDNSTPTSPGAGAASGSPVGPASIVSPFDLLNRETVRTELKLKPEQVGRIEDLARAFAQDRDELVRASLAAGGDRSPEALVARFDDLRKKSDDLRKAVDGKLRGFFSAFQFERYEQLMRHAAGPAALLRDDAAETLMLSADQRSQLKKIQTDALRASLMTGLSATPADRAKVLADRNAALLAVISPEQKEIWDEQLGLPPADGSLSAAPAGTSGSSSVTTGTGTLPVNVGIPPGAGDARPAATGIASQTSDERMVAAFSSTAKARLGASDSETDPEPAGPETTSDTPDRAPGNRNSGEARRLSFNFRFAPWDLVLKRFAEEAGLTLDMNETPSGTFNYFDDGSYTPRESLDILNGYLLRKGFILVRRDRFLVVVNIEKGVPPNLIPQVPISELADRGRNELLSIVIPLTRLDSKTAAEEVKPLLGPQGKAVPLAKVNQLFVTDIASNLQRIHDLLTGSGAFEEKKSTSFRSFKLTYVSAYEAERVLRDLFSLPARGTGASRPGSAAEPEPVNPLSFWASRMRGSSRGGWGDRGGFGSRGGFPGFGGDFGGDSSPRAQDSQPPASSSQQPPANSAGKLQLTADGRTNSLLVMGTPDELLLVEDAIKTIDTKDAESERDVAARGANVPQLEVYTLEGADPHVVLEVLNATLPGLVVHEDTKARSLNIYATPADHEIARNIVTQIDKGARESITVVTLRRLDPSAAAISLKALFSSEKADVPNIEADQQGRRLMIRGTPDQITQIKKLLVQLDGDGLPDVAAAGARGPMRTMSPGQRSADDIVSIVQKVMAGNPQVFIRVVPPSALSSPAFEVHDAAEPREHEGRRGGGLRSRDMEPASGLQESGKTQGGLREPLEGRDSSSIDETRPRSTLPAPVSRPSPRKPGTAGPRAARPRQTIDGRFASQTREVADPSEDPPVGSDALEPSDRSGAGAAAVRDALIQPQAGRRDAADSQPDHEVRLSIFGGQIIAYSEDPDALDRVERLIEQLAQSSTSRTRWMVYYLKAADAAETASMLAQLFQGATTTSSSRLLSSFGSGLSDSGTSGSLGSSTTPLRILPEARSNALFISGSEDQVGEVLEALRVLDATELPESLKDRLPRTIDVEYADVDDIAAIVRDVYREQMDSGVNPVAVAGGNNGRRQSFNSQEMFTAGGYGNMGGGQVPQQRPRPVQLSIGVDTRTNKLVVSANDQLFRQVEALVISLDESAREANRTVRVVTMKNANSAVVQQALSSLLGKVKVSTTGSTPPPGPQTPQAGPPPSNFNPPASQNDDVRSFFEQRMRERMMQRGPDGSGNSSRDGAGSSDGSPFGRRGRFGGRSDGDGGRGSGDGGR